MRTLAARHALATRSAAAEGATPAQRGLPEPKCWRDLARSEFRNEVQVADPNSSGTAYTMLATMVQLFGEEGAFDYMRRMHRNVNQYTRSGAAPARAVATGESLIGITFLHDAVTQAVAGAPVTDWRLYDTAYTERYLGDPRQDPAPYERASLLNRAAELSRPLLLLHGLADDNVLAAHTLQLSGALMAAGRPHAVIPLSGVTHMTPQEVVAENLLRLEVDFFRTHLGSR